MSMPVPTTPMAAQGPNWRRFLRALAAEIDGVVSSMERDALLRRVGAQMAIGSALPVVATLSAFEAEANGVLAELGWGEARFRMDTISPVVHITHTGLPSMGSLTGSSGAWLSPVLEGLYATWFGQQPGADHHLTASLDSVRADGALLLVYGRLDGVGPTGSDELP